ncbi:hypothetical protein HY797_00550 [Candidatus Falkowbacteria bacterium]|nr:hypothetical protein [Candidatus Falkowbacteria bacterium]
MTKIEGLNPESQPNPFERQKTKYFYRLAIKTREMLKFHKVVGLWQRKGGERDWGNVSEHCLVEVARADIFAEKLKLAGEVKRDLVMAAALHDFF